MTANNRISRLEELTQTTSCLQDSLETLNRMRAEYSEQLQALEHQRQQLADEVDRMRSMQTRFSRQRKALAQAFRAQRAELKLKESSLHRDLFVPSTQLLSQDQQPQVGQEDQSPPVNQIYLENRRLQSMLGGLQEELSDLRRQNAELASKVAQQTADHAMMTSAQTGASQEKLTWEARKRIILQQLELDALRDSDFDRARIADLHAIIEITEDEVARRDQEIEELREIIQTQATARDGIAIGAIGVAQILDADLIINAERQKLRDIQQEWESKLRQAEIDLSMERAKLARERVELEALRTQQVSQTASTAPGDKQQRRWLDFLGLKEEEPNA